jgi:hypothetical protein
MALKHKPTPLRITIAILLAMFYTSAASGQGCMSLFSYGANFETVNFINQSSISSAHYWWNFGDGTGSYFENPIHTYPETGRYLVTLFAKDTVSNCSDYYEIWINITKYSPDTCSPEITDSLFNYNGTDYLKIIDLSTNCSGYSVKIDGGPAANFSPGNWIYMGSAWGHARFLSRVRYYTYDTINGYERKREAYKSFPYRYSSSDNYDNCSANFEFTVVQEDSLGQRFFFKAMNNNAVTYEWTISGFGWPIHHYTDTMSHYYTFQSEIMWRIGLKTIGPGGCRDTLYQQILVRPGMSTLVGVDELSSAAAQVQVFPNPFDQQATLAFENPNRTAYTLTITSLTGQEVRTVKDVRGEHITIDRGNLASGIYFYSLRARGNRVATGKLIVQ